MRDYAVTLEFDKDSAARIQEMIDEVAVVTGCDHMKKYRIPPHVTVSCFVYDDEDRSLAEMDDIAKTLHKETVFFANIGIFNPLVIYLGPVMNEFLLNTCRTVNDRILRFAEVGNHGLYLPNQWVPHAAIAVKLSSTEALNQAFAIVQQRFSAFGATAERIVLARCEPYEELRSWELDRTTEKKELK